VTRPRNCDAKGWARNDASAAVLRSTNRGTSSSAMYRSSHSRTSGRFAAPSSAAGQLMPDRRQREGRDPGEPVADQHDLQKQGLLGPEAPDDGRMVDPAARAMSRRFVAAKSRSVNSCSARLTDGSRGRLRPFSDHHGFLPCLRSSHRLQQPVVADWRSQVASPPRSERADRRLIVRRLVVGLLLPLFFPACSRSRSRRRRTSRSPVTVVGAD
jgi:hypothetical protein